MGERRFTADALQNLCAYQQKAGEIVASVFAGGPPVQLDDGAARRARAGARRRPAPSTGRRSRRSRSWICRPSSTSTAQTWTRSTRSTSWTRTRRRSTASSSTTPRTPTARARSSSTPTARCIEDVGPRARRRLRAVQRHGAQAGQAARHHPPHGLRLRRLRDRVLRRRQERRHLLVRRHRPRAPLAQLAATSIAGELITKDKVTVKQNARHRRPRHQHVPVLVLPAEMIGCPVNPMFLDPHHQDPEGARSTSCARRVFGVEPASRAGSRATSTALKSVGKPVQGRAPARPRRRGQKGQGRRPRPAGNGQKKAENGTLLEEEEMPQLRREAARELGPVPLLRLVGGAGRAGGGRGAGAGARRRRQDADDGHRHAAAAAAAPCRARRSAGWCRSTGRRPASCSSSRVAPSSAPRADCDVVLKDPSISGRHAEFIVDERSGFRVNDLGSTNGTYVNDKRVTNTRSHRQRQRPARSHQLQVQVDELSPCASTRSLALVTFALVLGSRRRRPRAADKLRLERVD